MMRLLTISVVKNLAQYCLAAVLAGCTLCNVAIAKDIHPRSPSQAIQQLPPVPEAGGISVPAPEPTAAAPIVPLPSPISTPTPAPTVAPAPRRVPPAAAPVKPAQPGESLRQAAQRLKLPLPLPDARIVVTKSARLLELYNGKTLVKSYRVALGSKPTGHKQQQGDGRTPEGQFYICTRNASTSAFHIFLGLSYPTLPDATQAARKKIISWREYQLIQQRLSARSVPLWRTRLGGWVGIHGGTDAAFAQRQRNARGNADWTAGCIALTNREISEIHAATRLGTPVLVRP